MESKKIIEVFEAGKKQVHCKQCGTNYMTNKYPETCPFCKSRELIFELPDNTKEDKKKENKKIWLWQWKDKNGNYQYTRDIEKANEILHKYPNKMILATHVNENGIKKFRR